MKKTLSPAQIADLAARINAFVNNPYQATEFTDAEMGLKIDLCLDLGINVTTDLDFRAPPHPLAKPSTPVASAPSPGTKKMCIRVPNAVRQAFQDEAKRKCIPYQTLMIRKLKEASKGW